MATERRNLDVYDLQHIQHEQATQIALMRQTQDNQQKTLDEISKRMKDLVWLVFAGLIMAALNFAIRGGFGV